MRSKVMFSVFSGPLAAACVVGLLLVAVGCGGDADSASSDRGSGKTAQGEKGRPGGGQSRSGRPGGGPPGGGGRGGGAAPERGVPVEVAVVSRQDIAAYFQTQGTLEAENEVDLVARVAGPIEELKTEEGRRVQRGDLLARLDDRELAAQIEVTAVRLEESRQAYERVRSLHQSQLVSQEALDQSLASYQAAQGEHQRLLIQLEHTRITAPFSGLIVERYVKLAEHVNVGAQLFRLSDFDPLLCRIQVPERELRRLRKGQRAELTVEAWGDRRFAAHVLRVAPVVDADSGTVRVTLEIDEAQVAGDRQLDPGMFASVYLEMETRPQVVALPRAALSLDTLEESVFVVRDGLAERRTVELGLRNDRFLEVLSGVVEGDQVIVVGQDGLSDGTPVEPVMTPSPGGISNAATPDVTTSDAATSEAVTETRIGEPESGEPQVATDRPARGARGPGGRPFADIDFDDPQQVEQVKERMRQRGLTDAEIEQRLERIKQRRGDGS